MVDFYSKCIGKYTGLVPWERVHRDTFPYHPSMRFVPESSGFFLVRKIYGPAPTVPKKQTNEVPQKKMYTKLMGLRYTTPTQSYGIPPLEPKTLKNKGGFKP